MRRPHERVAEVEPADGTGLPGTVYGTPVEKPAETLAEPQPRHYAESEPRRAEQPYDRDPYANPTPPPAAYRNVPTARGGQEALFAEPMTSAPQAITTSST